MDPLLKIYDDEFYNLVKDGISSVVLEKPDETPPQPSPPPTGDRETPTASPSPSRGPALTCTCCNVKFADAKQHREHFKLDWHLYNLKRKTDSKPPVTECEFNDVQGDVSSISGSGSSADEDDDDEETLDSVAGNQGKVFLRNGAGKVFGLYKCLLVDKKQEIEIDAAFATFKKFHENPLWAIVMLGGGHFAGAVFDKHEPVLHKTLHFYTVRAGQGGMQSTRDGQSGGSHPKSAGASLRRANEMAFAQSVADIIGSWKAELSKCSLIICRAAGPYNRNVLFGGKNAPLDRADPRVRTVPFSTRRPTFKEACRVHEALAAVHVYDSADAAMARLRPNAADAKRTRPRSNYINRAKSRESVDRTLPAEIDDELTAENDNRNALVKSRKYRKTPPKETVTEEENENDVDERENATEERKSGIESEEIGLTVEEITIEFDETLRTFGDTLTAEERARKSSRARQKIKKQKEKRQIQARRDAIFEAARDGDVDKLKPLNVSAEEIGELTTDGGDTLLHVASRNAREQMILHLLDGGADLCARNARQETPYTCTKDRGTRDLFRRYASDNPDKFNYNRANVPTNVLTAEQVAEKKKQQRKLKKEKEKEKRKEIEIKRREQEERDRFLQLSDREKRALAAERRILNQNGTVTSRCFLCGLDISGKLPFEYSQYRFCSVECMKAHRMSNNANVLSV